MRYPKVKVRKRNRSEVVRVERGDEVIDFDL
jgi:hypothetical protein